MKLPQIDKLGRPQIIAIATAGIFLIILIVVGFVLPKNKKDSSAKPFKIISTSKTSPDKRHSVSEVVVGNNQLISVQDSSGNLITNDLVAQNFKTIGYGTKFSCPCETSFKGWVDNSNFVIEVTTSDGKTYQYLVDSNTGVVSGNSSGDSGGSGANGEGNSTENKESSSNDSSSGGSTNSGGSSGDGTSVGGSAGQGNFGGSGGGTGYSNDPAVKPRIIP